MGIPSKLDKHLVGSSILFWKINLLKQSLQVSMRAGWADFPHDIAKLMKSPAYRERIVRKNDLGGLNAALASIRMGHSAQVVFHIESGDSLTHWCLLAGNAQSEVQDAIYGSLICIDMGLLSETDDGLLRYPKNPSVQVPQSMQGLSDKRLEDLRRELARCDGLFAWLQAICRWDNSDAFEALLFSDVQQAEGKVVVHGAGDAFSDLATGRSFPYEGTIADMIVSLNLSYIVVDDTMESLKPIDWALFVPHGIRSYFAVPAFQNGTIRGVLIFCSSSANGFSEEQERFFSQISEVAFSLQSGD